MGTTVDPPSSPRATSGMLCWVEVRRFMSASLPRDPRGGARGDFAPRPGGGRLEMKAAVADHRHPGRGDVAHVGVELDRAGRAAPGIDAEQGVAKQSADETGIENGVQN